MIYVIYYPERPSLRVYGHAGSGPYGQDIVCAGVSAITYALEATLADHEEYNGHCERPAHGDFSSSALPKRCCRKACRALYQMAADGLKLMAANYPDFVEYRELKEVE